MQMNKVCLSIALLMLAIGNFAKADDDCVECGPHLGGMPTSSNAAAIESMVDPLVPLIAQQVCDYTLSYHLGGNNPGTAIEFVVSIHLDIEESDPQYHQKIISWWNKNSNQMVCTEDIAGYDSPQHVLKRIFEMGASDSFFRNYLQLENINDFNLNAVEWREGQPETVLDYLDTIIATPNIDEAYRTQVVALRNFLDSIGAKKGTEVLRT